MGDLDPEEYLAFVGIVIAEFLDEAKKAYERIWELEAELARFEMCDDGGSLRNCTHRGMGVYHKGNQKERERVSDGQD